MGIRSDAGLDRRAGERGSPVRDGHRLDRKAGGRRLGALALIAFVAVLCLDAGVTRAASGAIHAGLLPATVTVAPGDTFTVYMSILVADAQFNAFDASIRFDPARLSFEPIAPVADQRGVVMMSAC